MNDTELQEIYSLRNEYRSLRYDLRNIRLLCRELGHPERAFRSVLVGGTNGKGSVAHWLAAMLPEAGLFVSPHLERLNERVSIGPHQIDDLDLRAALESVNAAAERIEPALCYPPTYFERVTAMAFSYFRQRTRYAVLEVGLGGRLDATNVVSQDVSVITNIGLDHQEYLGDTLEAIAFEKAGIIKGGEPVVVGPRCDSQVIRERAGDRLVRTDRPSPRVCDLGSGFFEFDLDTPVRSYRRLRPGLAGRHQVENAVLAVHAAEALENAGWPIGPESIREGLQSARWPGRLERVGREAPILLDGAHNLDAALALARYLRSYHPGGVVLVFGAVRGKDCRGMLEALIQCASTLILTRPPSDRAVDPGELLGLAPHALVAPNVAAALALAGERRRDPETVLVAGSLFLVGEARSLLAEREPLPAGLS